MPDKLPSAEELAKAIDMQCHAQGAAYYFARTEASFLIDSAFAAISADGIAQGRREAADVMCDACGPSEKQRNCGFYCNGGDESYSCKTRRVMLGAAAYPQSKSWKLAEELLVHIKCGDLRCYSCEMRAKAILGTASDEKTDKGEI
jgi:hypothetical protein